MVERDLEEEMGLGGSCIGHLFQGEASDVVRDTWELVAEGACEEYGEQCLEALGDGGTVLGQKIIRWGMGVSDVFV